MKAPRVVAILASFNEERFIAICLEHLFRHGVETYLLDNDSTDRTVEIARRHLGRGLIGIETLPRARGEFDLHAQLRRKEELAASIDADWFMHADVDEIRLPPRPDQTLAQALAAVQERGFNAVNFIEYTFIPTREDPDHDHERFQETMRRYYAFVPSMPYQLKAWRRQERRVDLVASGGHVVQFPGLNMAPESFPMRHYPFLSVAHFREKYGMRRYTPADLMRGWHSWRNDLRLDRIALPSQTELRLYTSDAALDATSPRTTHFAAQWT